jgi:hypothetical protein
LQSSGATERHAWKKASASHEQLSVIHRNRARFHDTRAAHSITRPVRIRDSVSAERTPGEWRNEWQNPAAHRLNIYEADARVSRAPNGYRYWPEPKPKDPMP